VTGLLAQGVPAFPAAALAAFLHGAAADRIAARRGDTGLLAHELLLTLPAVISALRDGPAPDRFERELAAAFPEP
jgi:NAD(P)H-hydrate repair Nnr-like enzyme with NAD(P)H-hydrate dehydratase domain